MRHNLADPVTILKDVPSEGVVFGAVGFVVHIHGDHEAYTVELCDASGVVTGLVTEDAKYFSKYNPDIRAGVVSTVVMPATMVYAARERTATVTICIPA